MRSGMWVPFWGVSVTDRFVMALQQVIAALLCMLGKIALLDAFAGRLAMAMPTSAPLTPKIDSGIA